MGLAVYLFGCGGYFDPVSGFAPEKMSEIPGPEISYEN
jgi:hypothetical protein